MVFCYVYYSIGCTRALFLLLLYNILVLLQKDDVKKKAPAVTVCCFLKSTRKRRSQEYIQVLFNNDCISFELYLSPLAELVFVTHTLSSHLGLLISLAYENAMFRPRTADTRDDLVLWLRVLASIELKA